MGDVVNVHYAKTHLSKLLERVRKGAVITLAKAGKPVAKLVPIESSARRRPGGFKFGISEEFVAPLPDSELDAWER
ncbi:MAG: antitoxin [Gemmatimonadales bacterium]|nr:MAG: antitoxin [Gemmatimonadales bacterium]